MEIDGKLLKFKSEVVPHIGSMSSASNDLSANIKNFSDDNSHAFSEIKDSFNSQGMDKVTAEVAYLNEVTQKVYQSIGQELNKALSKCSELATGIEELEKLLEKYNTELANYNAASKDPEKTADRSALTKAENDFKTKQEECIQKHDELLAMDGSLTMLSAFSTPSGSNTDDTTGQDLTGSFGFNGAYAKYIYEENGIIYQRVMPIFKGQLCDMGTSYTVVYDKNKILSADQTAGSQLISWLQQQMNGQNLGKKLWNFNNKITGVSTSGIGKVMDVVMNDSYKANNCKTISQYASIAAMVMGVGPVNLAYGSSGKGILADGVENLVKCGATLDCIGFVAWCYRQGIYRTGSPDNIQSGSSMTPLNLYSHHSIRLATMTQEQKENLPVGTVLVKKTQGNLHVGIVVGYTTINGKKHVLVSQSSSPDMGGSIVWAYDVNTRFGDYNGGTNWERAATPELMERRVTGGSNSSTQVA